MGAPYLHTDPHALSPAAENAAALLERILLRLRALRRDADAAHDLMARHDLALDAPICVPDALGDFIGGLEGVLGELGARVPADAERDARLAALRAAAAQAEAARRAA